MGGAFLDYEKFFYDFKNDKRKGRVK